MSVKQDTYTILYPVVICS